MLSIGERKKILELKKNYSIYSVFGDPKLFKRIVDELATGFKKEKPTKVLGLEARGFILASVVAYRLRVGFVVARKGGRMYEGGYSKDEVLRRECVDYSNKSKVLEIEKHAKAICKGDKVLIIDDWISTGSQAQAVIRLVEKAGAGVVGIGVMLDDMNSENRKKLKNYKLISLVRSKKRLLGR